MRQLLKIWVIVLLAASVRINAAPLRIPDVDEAYPFVPDWRISRILHIGDSHLSAGLKDGLARYFRQSGAMFHQEAWVGSRCKSWVTSGKIVNLIEEHRPNVVVVTLGTNEMKNRKPSRNISWIRALIDKIGGRTCYWIGPPPLLEDIHGYNDTVKVNVMPCRYFDSRMLDVEMRANGTFHLTRTEGEAWAEMIWKWMNGR